MFFRLTMGCLLASLTAQAAFAQEVGLSTSWAGPYVGLSLGLGLSDGEAELGDINGALIARDVRLGLFPSGIDDGEVGVVGGAALGFNMERGGFVFGVELDVSAFDQDVTLGFSRVDPGGEGFEDFENVNTNTSFRTMIDTLASLRVRAGLVEGRNLFYATGGLAAGDVTNTFGLELPEYGVGFSNSWSEDGIRFGYAIGAGLEHRLSDRTSVNAEFLHFDLEDVTVHAQDPAFGPNTIDYRFKNDGQIVRVGVNFRF